MKFAFVAGLALGYVLRDVIYQGVSLIEDQLEKQRASRL